MEGRKEEIQGRERARGQVKTERARGISKQTNVCPLGILLMFNMLKLTQESGML